MTVRILIKLQNFRILGNISIFMQIFLIFGIFVFVFFTSCYFYFNFFFFLRERTLYFLYEKDMIYLIADI